MLNIQKKLVKKLEQILKRPKEEKYSKINSFSAENHRKLKNFEKMSQILKSSEFKGLTIIDIKPNNLERR